MIHQQNSVQLVIMHDEDDIKRFSEKVGISVERARYIESLRGRYLAWEHDYVKDKTPKKRSQIYVK